MTDTNELLLKKISLLNNKLSEDDSFDLLKEIENKHRQEYLKSFLSLESVLIGCVVLFIMAFMCFKAVYNPLNPIPIGALFLGLFWVVMAFSFILSNIDREFRESKRLKGLPIIYTHRLDKVIQIFNRTKIIMEISDVNKLENFIDNVNEKELELIDDLLQILSKKD